MNPATGEEVERFEEFTKKQLDACLDRAVKAFGKWGETSFDERAERIRAAAEVPRDHRRKYGEVMAREMGKPIRDGIAEAEKCAWACDFFAGTAACGVPQRYPGASAGEAEKSRSRSCAGGSAGLN